MKDYYQILGIKENASEEEIRAHWIKLMRRFHPDQRNEKGGKDERVKEINEAYHVLKHSSSRVEYDLKRMYERKQRRFSIKRSFLPLSAVILIFIVGLSYFYVKKTQSPALLKANAPPKINSIESKKPMKQPSMKQPPDIDFIPQPSTKIEKMIPKEMDREASGEAKEGVSPERGKVLAKKGEKLKETQPFVIQPPFASLSKPEGESKAKEKLSAPIALKSEMPAAAGKEVLKEISKVVSPIDPSPSKAPATFKPGESKEPIHPKIPEPLHKAEAEIPHLKSPPPVVKDEEEIWQFFSDYIDRYTKKDLNGFISLFSPKAVQNQKDGLEGIRKIYANFFSESQEIRYQLEDIRIEMNRNPVEVKTRYEIDQVLKRRGEKKSWRGLIRWTLIKEDGALKIFTIDYHLQSPPKREKKEE